MFGDGFAASVADVKDNNGVAVDGEQHPVLMGFAAMTGAGALQKEIPCSPVQAGNGAEARKARLLHLPV